MSISILQLARKYLFRIAQFTPINTYAELNSICHTSQIVRHKGKLIGIYTSAPQESDCVILYTTESIIMGKSGRWVEIPYCEISTVGAPTDKRHGDSIAIETQNGETYIMQVMGTDRKEKDIYPMMRFISRAAGAPIIHPIYAPHPNNLMGQ